MDTRPRGELGNAPANRLCLGMRALHPHIQSEGLGLDSQSGWIGPGFLSRRLVLPALGKRKHR